MPCRILALFGFDTVYLGLFTEMFSNEFIIKENGDAKLADVILMPDDSATLPASKNVLKIKLPLKTEEVITLKNRITKNLLGSA